MFVFKRKYSVNIQRNAFYFGILFVPFVAGWSCIVTYGFPQIAETPVYPEWLGIHFVFSILWVILGLIAYFLLGWILGKLGYIAYPATEIARNEIKAYNQKYAANFILPKGKARYYLMLFSSFLILFLFVWIPYLLLKEVNPMISYLSYGIGFILMCMVFYGAIRKIMQKDAEAMVEVFNHANSTIPQTKIHLEGQNLDYSTSQMSVSTDLMIKGQFKGHVLLLRHQAFGTRGKAITSGKIQLGTVLKLNFSISENDKLQNKITGMTLDECFKKRFKVKGIKVEQLTDSFKQSLLESFKSVDLKFEKGWIQHSFKYTYYLPFYSSQGLILFLDFLIDLENDLISEAI